jgi:ribose transport system permease protein
MSAVATPSAPERPAVLRRLGGSTAIYVLGVLVLLFVVFGVLSPGNRFLTFDNASSIGVNSASLMLIAVGLAFVLGSGNIDLSVGANLVLSSVVGAEVILHLAGSDQQIAAGSYPHELPAVVAGVSAGICTGVAMGALNGVLVTRLRVNSFVVTLGTMGIATGVSNLITNGANVANLPPSLQLQFGVKEWLGVPLPLIASVIASAVCWVLLRRTAFGRQVLAVGSSLRAARRAGVHTHSVTLRTFTLMGLMAGLAGVMDLTKFGTTALSGHDTDILSALSAVIIGGTSLFGGRASVGGAVIATFLPVTLLAGFVMLDVRPFWQYIAVGVILIAAVYLDGARRGRLGADSED